MDSRTSQAGREAGALPRVGSDAGRGDTGGGWGMGGGGTRLERGSRAGFGWRDGQCGHHRLR
jgi:hypothetical protein